MIRIFVSTPEEKKEIKKKLIQSDTLGFYIKDHTYEEAVYDHVIVVRKDMCDSCGSLNTISRIRVHEDADNEIEIKCNNCKNAKVI